MTLDWLSDSPLLATATEAATESDAEEGTLVLAGVLLRLVIIYFASKLGGELCSRINLPPVLGELVGGVLIGISAYRLLCFPETSAAEDSLIINMLQSTAGLP
ncbi:MAG: cation:proton antiporter, partial [Pleurocapsa sp.]